MMRTTVVMVCAAIAAAGVQNAFADLTMTGTWRSIYIDGVSNGPAKSSSDTWGAYADSIAFDDGSGSTARHAAVSMDTNVEPLKFTGSASAIVQQASPHLKENLTAHGTMAVGFETTTPYIFTIKGTLTQFSGGEVAQSLTILRLEAGAYSYVALCNPQFQNLPPGVETDTLKESPGPINVDYTGIIMPGKYQFYIGVEAFCDNIGSDNVGCLSTNVTLELAELPEPASLGILAAGAAGLLLRRRR